LWIKSYLVRDGCHVPSHGSSHVRESNRPGQEVEEGEVAASDRAGGKGIETFNNPNDSGGRGLERGELENELVNFGADSEEASQFKGLEEGEVSSRVVETPQLQLNSAAIGNVGGFSNGQTAGTGGLIPNLNNSFTEAFSRDTRLELGHSTLLGQNSNPIIEAYQTHFENLSNTSVESREKECPSVPNIYSFSTDIDRLGLLMSCRVSFREQDIVERQSLQRSGFL
ncbi:hypothetical protein Dimus_020240, partial [Dionaea muscipula]